MTSQPDPTRPEAFVELLPASAGYNLRHHHTPAVDRHGHLTGLWCACRPERIPHDAGWLGRDGVREVIELIDPPASTPPPAPPQTGTSGFSRSARVWGSSDGLPLIAGDDVLAEKDAEVERLAESLSAAELDVSRYKTQRDGYRADNRVLRTRLAAVEALHHPITYKHSGRTVCGWCDRQMGATDEWPCPTAKALASAPAVDAGDREPASGVFRAPTSFYEQTPSEVRP
jgi:hypothetical protein